MSILLEDEREATVRDKFPGSQRAKRRTPGSCHPGSLDTYYGEMGQVNEGCVRSLLIFSTGMLR